MKKRYLLPLLLALVSCSLLPQAPSVTPSAPAAPSPTRAPASATPPPSETQPPAETPLPTDTPAPAAGIVTGRVCYPSEFIPEMTAYFLNRDTQAYTGLPIGLNQAAYEVSLDPGSYLAFAWREDYGLGGGYTAAVACGMEAACSDHSLLAFDVQAGQTSSGIDLCDWILTDLPLPPQAPFPQGSVFPDLAGVLFSALDGLWLVDEGGSPEKLIGQPNAQLSRDGSYALFWDGSDIWRAPLDGGQPENLTNTPERVELLPRGWQSGSDIVLFPSIPPDMQAEPGFNGFLTMVRSDGSGYRVLDPEHTVWNFALSPDNGQVAYGVGPSGWLYRFADDSITPFDPGSFGLQNVETLASPSWSPDGGRLAWMIGFQRSAQDGPAFALAIFDLAGGTRQLFHPYELPGMDGYPEPGAWSPDGKWFAIRIYDIDFERSGLWVFDMDGDEVFLGGGNPIWSPDGSRLLISGPQGYYRLATAGSWETVELDSPPLQSWYALEWR